MVRDRSSLSLSLAYANPRAPVRPARKDARQRPRAGVQHRVIVAIVVGAIGWLLLGCSGLIWTIAFTVDPQPLALALAVWVLAFVAPSLIAILIAYCFEEEALRSAALGDAG